MIRIAEVENPEQVFHCQMEFQSPYFFPVDDTEWKKSFENDTDGAGRTLFGELYAKAAYEDDALIGFVQYGKTAFGFDDRGEISSDISYCVIRSLYFPENRADAGKLLLEEALNAFGTSETVYAFFHYFGMSCFARHGKLFEKHGHIEQLLKKNGFETEHENVYYSSRLTGGEEPEVQLRPQHPTAGNQQYLDFVLEGNQVGGCEIHWVDSGTAYLRWIYVNGDITGQGIGTKCMNSLKHWLHQNGITRFDTDTARCNTVAQHFYEKNGFTREGITRSYYRL